MVMACKACHTCGNPADEAVSMTYDHSTDGMPVIIAYDGAYAIAGRMRGAMMDYSYTYVIIGNGFDLELGLPTAYSDFLQFLETVKEAHEAGNFEFIRTTPKYDTLNNDIKEKLSLGVDYDLWKPGIENFWNRHFQSSSLQNGWIDFENEISKVIQILDKKMLDDSFGKFSLDNKIITAEYNEFYKTFYGILLGFNYTELRRAGNDVYSFDITYRALRDKLWDELNAFIRCFETYLREYVGVISLKPTENIKRIISILKDTIPGRRFVLSFNYTHTFEDLLRSEGLDCEFCYVHGKIGDGKAKNQMVLGIDEYLDNESAAKRIEFASFKKYNQRIYKCTDSNYIDWLDDCKKSNNSTAHKKLYIFGHSLGLTDKDIIGDFVKAEGMETTIFYHNDRTFNSMVSNMTAIIGMDEMIARNGGRKRTMRFLEQLHS